MLLKIFLNKLNIESKMLINCYILKNINLHILRCDQLIFDTDMNSGHLCASRIVFKCSKYLSRKKIPRRSLWSVNVPILNYCIVLCFLLQVTVD